jgi:regulator of PEP synthase PpsR (kinase-PPPase family)
LPIPCAIEELAAHLEKAAGQAEVVCVDILGPLLSAFRSVSHWSLKENGVYFAK